MRDNTVLCRFQVRHLERVGGCGRLLALALVALDVDGVELTLQGVRVMRGA